MDNMIFKMQKKSLRVATDALKAADSEHETRNILKSIIEMLSAYNCETTNYLIRRLNSCLDNIYEPILIERYLSSSEEVRVKMIVEELNEFLREEDS